jgi:hypothetical protein
MRKEFGNEFFDFLFSKPELDLKGALSASPKKVTFLSAVGARDITIYHCNFAA